MSGRIETVITAPVRGAARSYDLVWPAPRLLNVLASGPGVICLDRQRMNTFTLGSNTGFGVPPAGSGYNFYRGRICFKQTGSGTSGGYYLSEPGFITFPSEMQGGSVADDFSCWRIVYIAAHDGAALGSGDLGLEVGPTGFDYSMIVSANPGFRIGPSGANSVKVQVRKNGGGALTVDQVVGAVDVNDYQAYEMRFIGATATRDGIFKAFLNGVQVFASSWGAGTLLPTFATGANIGYQVGCGNRGSTVVYTAMCGLSITAASTEEGTL